MKNEYEDFEPSCAKIAMVIGGLLLIALLLSILSIVIMERNLDETAQNKRKTQIAYEQGSEVALRS